MALTPNRLEMLVKRVATKLPITRVFHPNLKEPRLIAMPNGVNLRFDRGPYGYQFKDGSSYPANVIRTAGN